MRSTFVYVSIGALFICALITYLWPQFIWGLMMVGLLVSVGVYDLFQKKHALRRTFPLIGRLRWGAEFLRPYLRQYFFESETDSAPINRMNRSLIYQRAKGERDTIPYGTKLDTLQIGYEWLGHSLAAKPSISPESHDPRITIGGPHCAHPYQASILNISGMSFGALSSNAIKALNKGAKMGGFAHNTGEGGISPYHLEAGGDLIWQIGTSYFGCRDQSGNFNDRAYAEKATQNSVRMIEVKLSQGAKPGHGGILPGSKNTAEIARIRGVEAGSTVLSPPVHSAFTTPKEFMYFIQKLRELSGGKPIGFKLAIGRRSEFISICKAMVETGIKPDFITVDGGEGGTGAAPLEYANSVGMPLREALAFVIDILIGFDLRKDIKVLASGKVFTGFDLVKYITLGADACNSARGMMVAMGCVQSLVCHSNHCPVGVATQNPSLAAGLVVSDKAERVARYHKSTVEAAVDLLSSAGLTHTNELNRSYVYRRVSEFEVLRYDEIFPYPRVGCLISGDIPPKYQLAMSEASADHFKPQKALSQSIPPVLEAVS